MKKLSIRNVLLISFLFVITFCCFTLFSSNNSYADTLVSGEKMLPNSDIEYYDLTSPTDVLIWEDNIAITENPKYVNIFNNGETHSITIPDLTATTVGQLRLLSDNVLIVLSNNKLYKIDLTTYSIEYLCDSESAYITCTYYAISNDYLITSSGDTGSASIYKIVNGVPKYSNFSITGISGNKPIAINGEYLVYVKNEKVYTRSFTIIDGAEAEEKLIIDANPDNILCENGNVYYNLSTNIHCYNIENNTDTILAVQNEYSNSDKYDLGNITALTNMSIVGDKIYITDNLAKTISEYCIKNNSLAFTGYAICKDKTAYNRIGNAIDIQRRDNLVAVLDDFKLTIINNEYTTPYETTRFTNLLVDNAPKCFALGSDSVVFADNENNVKLYRLTGKDKGTTFNVSASGSIDQIIYKCGKYYILTTEGLTTTLFTVNEDDTTTSHVDYINHIFDSIEVDICGSIYLGDGINLYKDDQVVCPIESKAKVLTDFSNNIFKCVNGKLYFYNGNAWDEIQIEQTNIISFALDFDKKDVYFVIANDRAVYSTDKLNNSSINSTMLPADFKISDDGTTITTIKTCTVDDSAIIFNVKTKDNFFKFNGFISKEDNYIYICDIVLSPTEKYICLSSQKGLVLVRENHVETSSVSVVTNNKTVYITTSVHAYYLPLITLDGRHQIDISDGKMQLAKHSVCSSCGLLTIFGEDFYQIKLENEKFAFVPVNFTVDVLSQNKTLNEFTTKTVSATSIFLDKELTNSYSNIVDDAKVNIVSVNDGVAKLLVRTDNGYIFGYINESAIKDEASITIRNILVIIAVLACACSSAIFFISKKKKD